MQNGVRPMKNCPLFYILKNKRWVWAALAGLCFLSCILNLCFGAVSFSLDEMWNALFHSSVEKTMMSRCTVWSPPLKITG